MSLIGWFGWAIVAIFIAGLDVSLSVLKHTTLSATWLQGTHNKFIRPAEALTFAALGAHLFTGASIFYVVAGLIATTGTVAWSYVYNRQVRTHQRGPR